MRIKKQIKNARDVRSLIGVGYRNVVKCSHGRSESPSHRNMKWFVCQVLYQLGVNFYTEVSFKGGGRADIVVEDWGCCFEILNSETICEFEKKKYPLPTVPLQTINDQDFITKMLVELSITYGGESLFYVNLYRKKIGLSPLEVGT